MRFSQNGATNGVHKWSSQMEFVGRVLSGHQLGKPSDVRRIMSSHEVSFVFIIQVTEISINYRLKNSFVI